MLTKTPPKLPQIRINWKQPRPVRLDVLEATTAIQGKALNLMVGVWLMASIRKSPTVMLTRRLMSRINISRFAATDALRRLEASGLVKVWRLPGRASMVTLVEPGSSVPLRFDDRS